ncbi:lysophospholipid acyltransferase family protein [Mycolicibacter acidiphilus]|uniref:lysophospholipid acyltransferase family protein n=1 Tax=Mycolicibacter acidiphilus TaxID=2835306 RepID=UPI002023163C
MHKNSTRAARGHSRPVAGRAPRASAEQIAAVVREIDELRAAAGGPAAEPSPNEFARRVAAAVTFLRERITGDYQVDEFGFDPHFNEAIALPILRVLFRDWFRVEVSGIENLPLDGPALVVANHAGVLPIDALMLSVAVHDEHPSHRDLRMLGADLVFDLPVVGPAARKAGHTVACMADAHRLLGAGELTAVFPEGYKGLGKRFKDRYKLQRFGRGGFVSAALHTKAPIIPCSIVGSEEIYPMLADVKLLARLLGVPYFPVTPLFPLAGPAGLVPLPSKWHIAFGEPIETADYEPGAAEDPMVTFELTDQVRETIQQTLYRLLAGRRNMFFG